MDFNLECTGGELVRFKNEWKENETEMEQMSDSEVEVINGAPNPLSIDDPQTATAASDLLQNGILVETNKG